MAIESPFYAIWQVKKKKKNHVFQVFDHTRKDRVLSRFVVKGYNLNRWTVPQIWHGFAGIKEICVSSYNIQFQIYQFGFQLVTYDTK